MTAPLAATVLLSFPLALDPTSAGARAPLALEVAVPRGFRFASVAADDAPPSDSAPGAPDALPVPVEVPLVVLPADAAARAAAADAQARARVGLVLDAAGGAAGFVTIYVGAVGLFGCALDDSCGGQPGPLVLGGGLVATSLAIGVGGGMLHGGGLAASFHLEDAGVRVPRQRAMVGLAFDVAALGCLGGAAHLLETGDDLFDAAGVVGLSTGGLVLWITSTALGARQLAKNKAALGAEPVAPAVRVGPMIDPVGRTVGVSGVW